MVLPCGGTTQHLTMGKGLGPTQLKVLSFLQEQWKTAPARYGIQGIPQGAVAAQLATTHSEGQAIRRAIRTLKDRKVIGTAHLQNEFDCWLVPVGENRWSTEPRPKAQNKMARFRDAITAELTEDWQSVPPIRAKVLGDRDAADNAWDWDRDRQLFNRAIKQLVKAGDVVSIGSTNKANQSGWQIRLMRDAERQAIAALNGKPTN